MNYFLLSTVILVGLRSAFGLGFCGEGLAYFNRSCWAKQAAALPLLIKAIPECAAQDTDIASLHSADEWDFFRGLSGGEAVWLGGVDLWPSWIDGTPWNISLIKSGVILASLDAAKSLFIIISDPPFISAIDTGPVRHTLDALCSSASVNGTCGTDWTGFGGRCFLVLDTELHFPTVEIADEKCKALGGRLASVGSEEEVAFVGETFRFPGHSFAIIIGLHYRQSSRVFRWLDGSETDYRAPLSADSASAPASARAGILGPDGTVQVADSDASHKAICRKPREFPLRQYRSQQHSELAEAAELACAEECSFKDNCSSVEASETGCRFSDERDLLFVVPTQEEPPSPPLLPSSCTAVKIRNASAASGVYELDVAAAPTQACSTGNALCRARVHCDMETLGGGWTAIHKRSDEAGGFESGDFGAYDTGFGDPEGNYWLGLFQLLTMTAETKQDLLVMVKTESQPNCYQWARYANFRLLDAVTYAFDFDAVEGPLDDILSPLKGKAFPRGQESCALAASSVCSGLSHPVWKAERGRCNFASSGGVARYADAAGHCIASAQGLPSALSLPAILGNGTQAIMSAYCDVHSPCFWAVSPAHVAEPPPGFPLNTHSPNGRSIDTDGRCAARLDSSIAQVSCTFETSWTTGVWCSGFVGAPNASGLWWGCGHGHPNSHWAPGCGRITTDFHTLPANWATVNDPARHLAFEGASEIRMLLRDSEYALNDPAETNWCAAKAPCPD